MSNPIWSTLQVVVSGVFLIFSGVSSAGADQARTFDGYGAQNFLTNNTLVYTAKDGLENSIYFGQFDNFDVYFPCQFETGAWKLSEKLVLSLTFDDAKFQSRKFKLARTESGFNLVSSTGSVVTTAKLLVGNRLPLG